MVSEASGEKLLGVAKIPSGTGENSANAVYEMLDRWNLLDKVQGMSFDTTAAIPAVIMVLVPYWKNVWAESCFGFRVAIIFMNCYSQKCSKYVLVHQTPRIYLFLRDLEKHGMELKRTVIRYYPRQLISKSRSKQQ